MFSRESNRFAAIPTTRTSRVHQRPRRRACRLEVLERREVLDASLQVVHNSPYEAAEFVDVYVNDAIFINDFEFRTATEFQTVPSGVDLKVDITAADAIDNSSPVFTATVNLAADTNYVAIAAGDPTLAVGPTAFTIAISDLGRQLAANPANAEFFVFHGSPDAPAVDVQARGVGTLIDDISFPEFAADYLSVPPAAYTIDVTLADGLTQVRSFGADLSGAAGAALVVAASGFVAPGPGDPDFGLLAVFADGTTALLPQVLPPSVVGTNGRDHFRAQLDPENPAILQVQYDGQTAQYLTLTDPIVPIQGLGGSDKLTVYYPQNGGALPTIFFDGGAGYDRAYVHGSYADDEITLLETSDPSGLPSGVLAFNSVKRVTVWAGNGNDLVDASGLQSIKTTTYGGRGNDELIGGSARDSIFGGWGNDMLIGNAGNDSLFGGFGNDHHEGGPGRDFMFDIFGRNTFDNNPWWRWWSWF